MHSNQPTFRDTPTRFQKLSFLLILALVTGVFLFMLRGYALTVLMAGVFTGLTYPIFKWVLRRVKKPTLASVITLLILFLVGVLPVIALSLMAYQEAAGFVGRFQTETAQLFLLDSFRGIQQRFPALFTHINPQDLVNMGLTGIRNSLQYILSQGANLSLSLATNLMNFFLMLFMMFYFYIDGERILARLIRWSPLRDDHEVMLLKQFLTVSKATLKGIFIIGLIQGAIGSILFACVGLHSPIFLGALMIFASIIPAVGGGLIWFPACVYLAIQGRYTAAIIVLVVGVFVIGTVDNLVRPYLVGKDTQMHDLMVLLSTLGGLALFGLPGFIIGPILAGLLLTMWTLYEQVFQVELRENAVTAKSDQV